MYLVKDMNSFAGSAATVVPRAFPFLAIENIHDDIHNQVGGEPNSAANTTAGTMYYLEVSAFDPIFWLHHAMVDRMLTMWQILNPTSWITSQQHSRTWTISDDDYVDGSTRK